MQKGREETAGRANVDCRMMTGKHPLSHNWEIRPYIAVVCTGYIGPFRHVV